MKRALIDGMDTQIGDRYGKTAMITAFNQLKTAEDTIQFDSKFAPIIPNRKWTKTILGDGVIESYRGGLRIHAGTTVGKSIMDSKYSTQYIPAVGKVIKMSIITEGIDTSGNCIREWGYVDDQDGFFYRLQGLQLSFVRRSGGVDTVYSSREWNIPVIVQGDTPDPNWLEYRTFTPNGHLFYIQFQWLGVADMYLWFGSEEEKMEQVHEVDFLGTSTEYSIERPDLSVRYKVENIGTVSQIYPLRSGCVSVVAEGANAREPQIFMASTESLLNISTTFAPVLTLEFPRKVNNIVNNRIARIHKIIVGGSKDGLMRLVKGSRITGSTPQNSENVADPTVAPTLVNSATVKTGTGFASGDTVAYKYVATTAMGSSLPSPSASISSNGNSIEVRWNDITHAGSYEIYRSINSGIFYKIATVPADWRELVFVDTGYNATATTEPTANTSIGDTFMKRIVGGTNAGGGRILMFKPIALYRDNRLDFEEGELVLYPGDTITVEVAMASNNSDASATIVWDEMF